MERFGPYELIEREEQVRAALRYVGMDDSRPLWEMAEDMREHHEWERRRLGLDDDRHRRDACVLRDALAGKNDAALEDLAERSGVARATLYRIRAGQGSVNPDTFDALADELGFQRDVVDGEEWIDALMAAARADSEEWWNSMEFWRVFYTHMNESVLKTMGVLLFDDLPAGFGSTPEIGTVSVRRLRRSAGRAGRSPRRTCASTATGTRWRSSYPTETRATSYAKTSAFAATSS